MRPAPNLPDATAIELQPLPINPDHEEISHNTAAALPPIDGGKDAYIALAGAFVLEALVWGFPISFGIFQKFYSTHKPFSEQQQGIAAISTTALALMYFSSPLIALANQRWPAWRRTATLSGWAICVLSLVIASLVNSTGALLATQGVLYAVGGSIMYFPCMTCVDEWFVARKGFAFGIVWMGTSVSGAVVPWILQWLLDGWSFRTTLRVWAIVLAILALPSVLAMKSRLPVTGPRRLRPVDWSFTKRPSFWFYMSGVIMQSLAYFLPSLWLPSFALDMGMPAYTGPLALCFLNIGATFGYPIQGRLVDRFHVTATIFVVSIVSAIAAFLLWGFTTSQAMLYVFAIVWGVSAAGYGATWAGCVNDVRRSCTGVDTGLLLSLMCAGKGVGSVIMGPVSELLLQAGPWRGARFAYGSDYGAVIVFTGITAMLGGSACVGRALKLV